MQTNIDEVADGVYRLSTTVPDTVPGGFTFNQYLLTGDEPMLFHTDARQLFPLVSDAVARVIDLDTLRWISFGHVESVTARGSAADASAVGAGIGGGSNGRSGEILVSCGTVVATGSASSAGIGGGGASGGNNEGNIRITGGSVIATGGRSGSAGIGSAAGRSSGPITITGGTVTATGGGTGFSGGEVGPGIGHTRSGGGAITISGGTVSAVGGDDPGRAGGGAGIGGGQYAPGVTTQITGGTVVATAGTGAAAIGGGSGSPGTPDIGAAVTIGTAATVTVNATTGNAIGNGANDTSFGSLENAGHLTIGAGSTLTIPAATRVVNGGILAVNGSVVNRGTLVNTGEVTNPGNVSVHHYLLTFDHGDAAGPAPADVRVFAATLADAEISVPADPEPRPGHTQVWSSALDGGDALTASTILGEGATGPLTQTWYSRWILDPPVWGTPPAFDLTVGDEAELTIPVSSAEDLYVSTGTLPAGLTLDLGPEGAVISGIPEEGTDGTHVLQLTASNSGGSTTLEVTLTVAAPTPPEEPPPPTPEDPDPTPEDPDPTPEEPTPSGPSDPRPAPVDPTPPTPSDPAPTQGFSTPRESSATGDRAPSAGSPSLPRTGADLASLAVGATTLLLGGALLLGLRRTNRPAAGTRS